MYTCFSYFMFETIQLNALLVDYCQELVRGGPLHFALVLVMNVKFFKKSIRVTLEGIFLKEGWLVIVLDRPTRDMH